MNKWNQLVNKESIDKAIKALKANGIDAKFVETANEAKKEVLSLIPEGAEVMNMTSVTLDTLGLPNELNESGKYNSIRNKLNAMDWATQSLEMQKMGAAPEWAVGSVHALTEDGHVLIVSNSGSQLPAYVYGAGHVIWVVGAQKIVKNTDEGIKRIYEYVLPLEDERAQKAYGVGSGVSKLLIINKEKTSGRITMIIVNEVLGF
ncbi:MAG: hypothetical protein G01um10147_516 [Microgenomates group bacterium Gr01-1014_7]|nr:MAG: hypothetical protein G01um10147_516 [Microgenomates group bacterium Gr01-1014_7]